MTGEYNTRALKPPDISLRAIITIKTRTVTSLGKKEVHRKDGDLVTMETPDLTSLTYQTVS